jgi:hypothetical protein
VTARKGYAGGKKEKRKDGLDLVIGAKVILQNIISSTSCQIKLPESL